METIVNSFYLPDFDYTASFIGSGINGNSSGSQPDSSGGLTASFIGSGINGNSAKLTSE